MNLTKILYKIFYDLFLEPFLMSSQVRIVLSISIILSLITKAKVFYDIIHIFYLPLMLTFMMPTLGIISYYLKLRKEKSNGKVLTQTNITKYSYKILLLIYLIFIIKVKINKKIFIASMIYILLYYTSFDSKEIYDVNKLELGIIYISSLAVVLSLN